MLNRKPFVEDHRQAAEGKLAARLELLKARGLDDSAIRKDVKIKQYQAAVRKAKRQMAGIGAMETLADEKAAAKAKKAAAAKAPPQATGKAAKGAAPKKPKKVKKAPAGSES